MLSLGVILAIVGVIGVIVLLYMWPEIFGRTRTEYFENAPPTPPATNSLPINSMSPTNLLQAVAVPDIKSLEGFQSGSVNTNFNDGNGQADSTATSDQTMGGGYNIQPMDNPPMSGTAAGSGNPLSLTSYTPPLANVVIPGGPGAGTAAGAGALMTGTPSPVVGYTSVNSPSPLLNGPPNPNPNIPSTAPTEMNVQVLNSGQIPIGDVTTGSYASEDQTSTPSFTVAASQLDANAVDNLKTNIASGGQYKLNVTCDIPNISYSFPLAAVTNVTNNSNQVYAYTFHNDDILKPGPMFLGAHTLNFQVVQTAPLPTTAPNAPPPPPQIPAPTPSGVASQTTFSVADCGTLGYPSSDNVSRLYNQADCNTLTGVWNSDGTCNFQGGSFSSLCSFLNTTQNAPPSASSTPANVGNMTSASGSQSLVPPVMNNAQGQMVSTQQSDNQMPSNGTIILQTGPLQIGDLKQGNTAMEVVSPTPIFNVSSSAVDATTINTLKTNLASGGIYIVSVGSDVPGLNYTFPLAQLTDVIDQQSGQTIGYSFANSTVQKQNMIFNTAKVLSLQVTQTGSLPSTAPNAQLATAPLPTPPNAISSQPPSTMASVLPATAIVSPTNAYTFTNQSIMMDASTLAQKIRSAELMIKCNNM